MAAPRGQARLLRSMLSRDEQVAGHVEELLDVARVEGREVEAVAAAGRLPNLGAKMVEQAAAGVGPLLIW